MNIKDLPLYKKDYSKHSKYSPSGAVRWLACSASVHLSERVPEKPSSVYAEEGTKAHKVAEMLMEDIVNDNSAKIIIGKGATDEMLLHANAYKEFVKEYIEKLKKLCPKGKDKFEILVEEKVSWAGMEKVVPHGVFGTIDLVILNKEMQFGIIVDYKYGMGVHVDVEENTQLAMYAVMLADKYKLKKVGCHIFQPRVAESDPNKIWKLNSEDLAYYASLFYGRIKEIEEGHFEYKETQKGCQFCDASGICEVKRKAMSDKALCEFFDSAPESADAPKEVIKVLSNERIAEILKHKDEAIKWLKSIEELAKNKILSGEEIEGFKVVAGTTRRTWDAKSLDEIARLIKKTGIDPYEHSLISPAKAEKIKEIKESSLMEEISKYIYKPEGLPTLVENKDKRQPIAISQGGEF